MSEHLKQAREYLTKAIKPTEGRLPSLVMVAQMLLLHLEAQEAAAEMHASQQTEIRRIVREESIDYGMKELSKLVDSMEAAVSTAPSPTTASQSKTPSSEATETQAETKPTSTISFTSSFLASQAGKKMPFLQQGILDWLSSQSIVGEVLVVATGATGTSRATTPPSGSASPSTPPPPQSASGSSSASGAPGAAAGESPSRAGRDAADAPSPTGSSEPGVCVGCGKYQDECKCGGSLPTPARPQWPEPKPGEAAWSASWNQTGLEGPDGHWFTTERLARYLNALYRGEVGPRDRWPL